MLIQLWIAEGFIQETGGGEETMEDVAEQCLDELNQRNMIKVFHKRSNGSIEKFYVHGLLREFAISKGRKEKFLDVLGTKHSTTRTRTMSRRLAIHLTTDQVDKGTTEILNSSSLNSPRSLLCFNYLSNLSLEGKSFYESFKFVRVLDLRGATDLKSLPHEIGKLVLLKYLNLYGTMIKRLPSSIRNLQNLQTLGIYKTHIDGIPPSVWELEELRHFYGNLKHVVSSNSSDTDNRFSCNLPRKIIHDYCHSGDPLQIGRLRNLRTLSTTGDSWISNGFSQLTNLSKLRITELNMDHFGEALSNSILNFTYFRELDIQWKQGKLQFPDSLSHHVQLYKMKLSGVMEKIPMDPNVFPPNLNELELSFTDLKLKLEDGPMKTLAALKNLKLLKLRKRSLLGNQMVFPARGFPNLIHLDLSFMSDLEELKVEEGSFPKLKFLSLVSLESLRELPDGLRKVKTLEKLYLLGMPPKFREIKIENDVGEPKINHKPSIKFGPIQFELPDLLF